MSVNDKNRRFQKHRCLLIQHRNSRPCIVDQFHENGTALDGNREQISLFFFALKRRIDLLRFTRLNQSKEKTIFIVRISIDRRKSLGDRDKHSFESVLNVLAEKYFIFNRQEVIVLRRRLYLTTQNSPIPRD